MARRTTLNCRPECTDDSVRFFMHVEHLNIHKLLFDGFGVAR